MSYKIVISKAVQKQINALPGDIYDRVIEKLQHLLEEPRPSSVVKLKGTDNEYRIRVGDYRVRYEIDDQNKTIQLLQCKHRREVYRE
ncbi:MAG: type II toxin-antitoxin system RelE family toxin [Leptolyngbya sp. IPPAS B-1204]|nr:type II toxin-antitoxin system RelE/ParE family toxin [Elainella sp. C42_A2020_010]RNJ70178.1 MAG: type II toxin-antitoxin system RelE/ParE family toxin [Leptolyngbya sp. IPPAS B-1204]